MSRRARSGCRSSIALRISTCSTVRPPHLTLLMQSQPHPRPGRTTGQGVDQRRERRVLGRVRDQPVEGDVGLHDPLVIEPVVGIDQELRPGQRLRGLGELLRRDHQGCSRRSLRLQHAPNGVQVGSVLRRVKVDHELHGCQEQPRVQRCDVRAITLTRLEDAHRAQRSHPFAKRAARHPQCLGEIPLDRQSRPGSDLAGHDHLLDALHDDLGLRDGRTAPCACGQIERRRGHGAIVGGAISRRSLPSWRETSYLSGRDGVRSEESNTVGPNHPMKPRSQ